MNDASRTTYGNAGYRLAILGLVSVLVGVVFAPDRLWPNLLLASYLVLGFGLFGAAFIAMNYVAGAGWNVSFRRVPEAMLAGLPIGAAGLLLVFLRPSLYAWPGPDDPVFRQVWFSLPFFWGRALAFLLLWMVVSYMIVRASRDQDGDASPKHTQRAIRLSAFFLVSFGFTFWLATTDWIMFLDSGWYSTIFGIYNFAGLFLSGIALLIILVVGLRNAGPLRDFVTPDQLHDLGKLLFAFSSFWMYIWFCQYMLIWYANFPEEGIYFTRRRADLWEPIFLLNVLLNWLVPFLALLARGAKREASFLFKIASIILIGRWIDLYLMIMPAAGSTGSFGIWEIGMAVGAVGVFLIGVFHCLRKVPIVPVNDPLLTQSLHYHS